MNSSFIHEWRTFINIYIYIYDDHHIWWVFINWFFNFSSDQVDESSAVTNLQQQFLTSLDAGKYDRKVLDGLIAVIISMPNWQRGLWFVSGFQTALQSKMLPVMWYETRETISVSPARLRWLILTSQKPPELAYISFARASCFQFDISLPVSAYLVESGGEWS